MVLITHDLGVVAGIADRVLVMYAGRAVEVCDVDDLYYRPRMPYTIGLLGSLPRIDTGARQPLTPIAGRAAAADRARPGLPVRAALPDPARAAATSRSRRSSRPSGSDHAAACHYAAEIESLGLGSGELFEAGGGRAGRRTGRRGAAGARPDQALPGAQRRPGAPAASA